MNKPLVVLFSALFSHTIILGMMPDNDNIRMILKNRDTYSCIKKSLTPEDQNDWRLVCKECAYKDQHWKFMPKRLEKKFDKTIKKKGQIRQIDKLLILYSFVAENDYNTVQWIKHYGNSNVLQQTDLTIYSKYITDACIMKLPMLAIQNNNYDMAELLFDPSENWKTSYKTLTLPSPLQQCLPNSHDRDFSFLFYIVAIKSGDNKRLKKLYSQKRPFELGKKILLDIAISHNKADCLQTLLCSKKARNIVNKNRTLFFKKAIKNHAQEVARTLMRNDLFNINHIYADKATVLDFYNQHKKYKDDKEIHAILRSLGASTYKELIAKKPWLA